MYRWLIALALVSPIFLASCGDDEPGTFDHPALELTGDTANGEILYADHCAVCHGDSGEGTVTGPPMAETVSGLSKANIVQAIVEGADSTDYPAMAPVAVGTDQDIADVTAYVQATYQ